jgi:hypothetical protein
MSATTELPGTDKLVVYVAGPMRNYPRYNFDAFDECKGRLEAAGYEVISPADLDRALGFDPDGPLDGFDFSAAMERDLQAVMAADCVCLLPGWQKSSGAKVEVTLARFLKKQFLDARDLQLYDFAGKTGLTFDRGSLLELHDDLTTRARDLMTRKNHDYAGKGGENPFTNFLLCEAMGLCSTEAGMVVRLSDKLSRLATFVSAGELLVKDESVEDTLLDIINYAVLVAGQIRYRKAAGKQERDDGQETH